MPVAELTRNMYEIQNLTVGRDAKGVYVSMVIRRNDACVLCLSKGDPVKRESLSLTEEQLRSLATGGCVEPEGLDCRLVGITRNQLLATPNYRSELLAPPVWIQAWGLARTPEGELALYVPADPRSQCCFVPLGYQVEQRDGGIAVYLEDTKGYVDGELQYQVGGRLPVPIPKDWIGAFIPLRNASEPVIVRPVPSAGEKYIKK